MMDFLKTLKVRSHLALGWVRKRFQLSLKLPMFILRGVLAPEPSWMLTWHWHEYSGSEKGTLTLATSMALNTASR